jgi:hypothetical protein
MVVSVAANEQGFMQVEKWQNLQILGFFHSLTFCGLA